MTCGSFAIFSAAATTDAGIVAGVPAGEGGESCCDAPTTIAVKRMAAVATSARLLRDGVIVSPPECLRLNCKARAGVCSFTERGGFLERVDLGLLLDGALELCGGHLF